MYVCNKYISLYNAGLLSTYMHIHSSDFDSKLVCYYLHVAYTICAFSLMKQHCKGCDNVL